MVPRNRSSKAVISGSQLSVMKFLGSNQGFRFWEIARPLWCNGMFHFALQMIQLPGSRHLCVKVKSSGLFCMWHLVNSFHCHIFPGVYAAMQYDGRIEGSGYPPPYHLPLKSSGLDAFQWGTFSAIFSWSTLKNLCFTVARYIWLLLSLSLG